MCVFTVNLNGRTDVVCRMAARHLQQSNNLRSFIVYNDVDHFGDDSESTMQQCSTKCRTTIFVATNDGQMRTYEPVQAYPQDTCRTLVYILECSRWIIIKAIISGVIVCSGTKHRAHNGIRVNWKIISHFWMVWKMAKRYKRKTFLSTRREIRLPHRAWLFVSVDVVAVGPSLFHPRRPHHNRRSSASHTAHTTLTPKWMPFRMEISHSPNDHVIFCRCFFLFRFFIFLSLLRYWWLCSISAYVAYSVVPIFSAISL